MNELERHWYYRQALIDAYHLSLKAMKAKYNVVNYDSDIRNGFKSYAIKANQTIIFVTIGTNSLQDLGSDLKLLFGKIPSHAIELKIFIQDTMQNPFFKNYKIELCGHSLGGSANTIVATKYLHVNEVINFNPFGTKEIIGSEILKYPLTSLNKIINYCNLDDDIATYKLSNQVGICYTIYTEKQHNAHWIDNILPLSTRQQFNQNDKTLETRIRQRQKKLKEIKNNVIQKVRNNFSTGYASNVSSSVKKCAGTYHVNGYKRADGTEVSDYYRTCGAKHLGNNDIACRVGKAGINIRIIIFFSKLRSHQKTIFERFFGWNICQIADIL